MTSKKFNNVWDALEDTAHEAASMRARSELMTVLRKKVLSWNMTQKKAAHELGITQPRLNDLLQGRISNFSLDALFDLACAADITITLKAA